jgi:hypothetical protein
MREAKRKLIHKERQRRQKQSISRRMSSSELEYMMKIIEYFLGESSDKIALPTVPIRIVNLVMGWHCLGSIKSQKSKIKYLSALRTDLESVDISTIPQGRLLISMKEHALSLTTRLQLEV